MIEIEIKGHYGQFIKGFLRRLIDDKAVIVYNDQDLEEIIPLSELRLPPKSSAESLNLAPQQHVEAFIPIHLNEEQQGENLPDTLNNLNIQPSPSMSRLSNPLACLTCPSWWPCIVTKVRDDHAVIRLMPTFPTIDSGAPKEYTDLANILAKITEICERKSLRCISGNVPCLSLEKLHIHKIEIPQEILSYASDVTVHDTLFKHVIYPVSYLIEDKHLVIISPSEEALNIVKILEELHLRMLRQKFFALRNIPRGKNLPSSTFNRDNDKQVSFEIKENHFVESFSVESNLMGLAIGTQGSNIRAAREIAGVLNISIQESEHPHGNKNAPTSTESTDHQLDKDEIKYTFQVVAETQEAAKAARAILDIRELCMLVPQRLIGRILGVRTTKILAINEKSGVKHIHLEGDPKNLPPCSKEPADDPNHLPKCIKVEDIHPHSATQYESGRESGFFIVGTRESVEKARLLITFQIDCIFELENLENEKIDLMRDLPQREPRMTDRGDVQFAAGPRRNVRGGGRGRGWQTSPRDTDRPIQQQNSQGSSGLVDEPIDSDSDRYRRDTQAPRFNAQSRQRSGRKAPPHSAGDVPNSTDNDISESVLNHQHNPEKEAQPLSSDRNVDAGSLRRGNQHPQRGRRGQGPRDRAGIDGEDALSGAGNNLKGSVEKLPDTTELLLKETKSEIGEESKEKTKHSKSQPKKP